MSTGEDPEFWGSVHTIRNRMVKVVVGLVGLAVVWAVLQAVLPDERETTSIAEEIQAWREDRTRSTAEVLVDCPNPVEWRVGETFNCVLEQGRATYRVAVTMENDQGEVTWVLQ